jgi:hypothetical protein
MKAYLIEIPLGAHHLQATAVRAGFVRSVEAKHKLLTGIE